CSCFNRHLSDLDIKKLWIKIFKKNLLGRVPKAPSSLQKLDCWAQYIDSLSTMSNFPTSFLSWTLWAYLRQVSTKSVQPLSVSFFFILGNNLGFNLGIKCLACECGLSFLSDVEKLSEMSDLGGRFLNRQYIEKIPTPTVGLTFVQNRFAL